MSIEEQITIICKHNIERERENNVKLVGITVSIIKIVINV